MTHTELFQTYLHHYADKNLEAISAMLAEDTHTCTQCGETWLNLLIPIPPLLRGQWLGHGLDAQR
ncbi:hypothetical protein [Candidatus Villigracilis affinis]|uniref:hypothetical protein n=1 Tax=Candidatus Villigracilis affinis TaxID=3140682 RepID=UPI001D533013|nr:hypothetical protein [Anaerolineales bacterium]